MRARDSQAILNPMRRFLPLALLLLGACSGTAPRLQGLPEQGISAVIIAGRLTLPAGSAKSGRLFINLEGTDGGEVYRLPVAQGLSLLYQVEPGLYRVSPTRSFFGRHQENLAVRIEGKTYSAPFPREILRKSTLDIKPRKVLAIGIVEATVTEGLGGQPPTVRLRLDDGVDARRKLVQDVVRDMMDPAAPPEARESAIAWSRALQNSLLEVLAETERGPLYKASQ